MTVTVDVKSIYYICHKMLSCLVWMTLIGASNKQPETQQFSFENVSEFYQWRSLRTQKKDDSGNSCYHLNSYAIREPLVARNYTRNHTNASAYLVCHRLLSPTKNKTPFANRGKSHSSSRHQSAPLDSQRVHTAQISHIHIVTFTHNTHNTHIQIDIRTRIVRFDVLTLAASQRSTAPVRCTTPAWYTVCCICVRVMCISTKDTSVVCCGCMA